MTSPGSSPTPSTDLHPLSLPIRSRVNSIYSRPDATIIEAKGIQEKDLKHISMSDAELMALELKKRAKEKKEAEELINSLTGKDPEKVKSEELKFRNANEAIETQKVAMANAVGDNDVHQLSQWIDNIHYYAEKYAIRPIKNNPITATAAIGVAAFPFADYLVGLGKDVLSGIGKTYSEEGLLGILNNIPGGHGFLADTGLILGGSAVGAIAGYFAGNAIDKLTKKWFGATTQNYRWTRYAGGLVGGLSTTIIGLGLGTLPIWGISAIPLGIVAGKKWISHLYHKGRKGFDVEKGQKSTEVLEILKKADELKRAFENTHIHDGDITHMFTALEAMAKEVTEGKRNLTELEAEWGHVKHAVDKKIEKGHKKHTDKFEAKEIREEAEILERRYRRVAGIDDGENDDITSKFQVVYEMSDKIQLGVRDASFIELEAEWKRVKAQVEKAIEKKHTKEDKKIEADEVEKEVDQALRMYRRAVGINEDGTKNDGTTDAGDELVIQLEKIKVMVNKVKSGDVTYAELEAEWKRVKERAEKVTSEKYEVAAKHTPLDKQKVQFCKDELIKMLTIVPGSAGSPPTFEAGPKWKKLPITPIPPMPDDLMHDLEEVQDMIANFETDAPRYTREQIEGKFNGVQQKFNAEFEDVRKKDKEKGIGLKVSSAIDGMAGEIKKNPEVKDNPAARSGLLEIDDIQIQAKLLNEKLQQRARNADEAKNIVTQLETLQTSMEQKVSGAKSNAEKATLAAEAIESLLGNDDAKEKIRTAMSALGNLPSSFRRLGDVVQSQSREVKQAMKDFPMNYIEAEKNIKNTNANRIIELRKEIASYFADWKGSPITPGTKGSRFIREFEKAFEETSGEKFDDTRMESFVKNADENLQESTEESMDNFVIALMQLKTTDAQNPKIEPAIKNCKNPTALPSVGELQGIIKPYLKPDKKG